MAQFGAKIMSRKEVNSIGSVAELWRYPVKSMLGEAIDDALVLSEGFLGDRAYALIDQSSGRVASAKNPVKWEKLLSFKAAYSNSAAKDVPLPPPRITMPNGSVVFADQENVDELISDQVGCPVHLTAKRPESPAVERLDPFSEGETIVDVGSFMMSGRFSDYAAIHILTTSSLECLRGLYPTGCFDPCRFRPNIVIDSIFEGETFLENEWVGRVLKIGHEVRLGISDPSPRCAMTTLAQSDLPRDLEILHTIAKSNSVSVPVLDGKTLPSLGVYGFVEQGGTVCKGDSVLLV